MNKSHRSPMRARRPVVQASSPWIAMARRYAALSAIYLFLLVMILFGWFNLSFGMLAPYWVLAPIFVLSIRYSELAPGWMLFCIGIFTDIFIGTPLGVQGVGLLAIGIMGRLQQRYLQTQNFLAVWMDYAALTLGFSVIMMTLILMGLPGIVSWHGTIMGFSMSWIATVLLFPPLALITHGLINLLRRAEA